MDAPAVETFTPVDLRDALVVAAFPTTGSASSIAAQYLVRHLALPLVGHVRVPEFAAVTAIQDGQATAAVRIHGGQVACRLERDCPRIYVATTELAPPPAAAGLLAEALLAWAGKGGAHLVLALEGLVRAEGDESPDVFCASADPAVLRELRATGLPGIERALIGGITAHLLLQGRARQVRSGAVLVEASREHPDGRAAARLIEALARFVPDVPLDAKPLMEEATELERQIGRLRTGAGAQAYAPNPHQFI